jgi:hypothetical protein
VQRSFIDRLDRRRMVRLALFLLVPIVGLAIAGHKPTFIGLGGEALILMLGFGFIPDLLDGHGEDAPNSGGLSRLEHEIRELLDELNGDFYILHDIESPHGALRHVVFGRKAGVFLIEAKPNRNDPPLEDNPASSGARDPETHVLDRCVEKAYWLRDRITSIAGEKPWITPLLVLPNEFVPLELKVDGVRVINTANLVSTLYENGGRRRRSPHIWDARRLIADSLQG